MLAEVVAITLDQAICVQLYDLNHWWGRVVVVVVSTRVAVMLYGREVQITMSAVMNIARMNTSLSFSRSANS